MSSQLLDKSNFNNKKISFANNQENIDDFIEVIIKSGINSENDKKHKFKKKTSVFAEKIYGKLKKNISFSKKLM